jgi:intracellular multiplication protein IcmJ
MSNLYPLKLAVIPDGWRLFSVRKIDPAFKPFKKKVLQRDQYMCRYCGFQAKRYQDIVNFDLNYHNNKFSNLITACCFCSQCFFLEAVGKDDYGGGVLVYMPEITQNDLNGFCHVLFCAMGNTNSYSTDAQEIYRNLKSRSRIVEKHLGEGVSDASLFGRMLLDAPAEDKVRIEKEMLPKLRLLPSFSKFSEQIRGWSEAMTEELNVEN